MTRIKWTQSVIENCAKALGLLKSTKKPLMYNCLYDLIFIILTNVPRMYVMGFQHLRPYFLAYSLYRFSNTYTIIDNVKEWPTKVFLSNHHRRSSGCIDYVTQFIPDYKNIKVVTDFSSSGLFGALLGHFFPNFSIRKMTSDEKYWSLVSLTHSTDAVSVYPDRDGSQFFGDTSMTFRPGLFAASMYTGVPIVDLVVVEPTGAHDDITIVFNLWRPPGPTWKSKESRNALDDTVGAVEAVEYATWRHENKNAIDKYTLECENDFKVRLSAIEAAKSPGFCQINYEVCTDLDKMHASIRRNNRAKNLAHK